MRMVGFTQMKDGTAADYQLLQALEREHARGTAHRILRELQRQADESLTGYRITRLEHALQSATRARADGADDDWIVCALLHDLGDGLAPANHDRFAAEILRPYVRQECAWVVEHHGVFQSFYYGHFYGWDRHARDRYRGSPFFDSCAAFCERWDQSSFDPAYRSEPLEAFAETVERVFARTAYDPAVIRDGVVIGVPRGSCASDT